MFVGNQNILELIKLLKERKVSFYHACQLQDLISYLKVGGIPSRGLLESLQLDFTPFKSDANDRKTADWNRVFLNMNDFGNFFHSPQGSGSTPNVYGPILIKLDPDCIEDSDDVAICLCSAGSENYDRSKFSLSSISEVENLFSYDKTHGLKSSWLKSTKDLKNVFTKIPVKGSPEVSCTVTAKKIKLDYITSVTIDPVEFGGDSLFEKAKIVLDGYDKILGSMLVRPSSQRDMYSALVGFVGSGETSIKKLHGDSILGDWAQKVQDNGLDWQFERFSDYLNTGTLQVMNKVQKAS